MELRPILLKLGLNKKQADVYLACLEHGPETITRLASLSGYKRSSIYHLIRDLLGKGFILLVKRNRRTLYDAEKPRKLLTFLRARERELEQALPELEKIRNGKQETPKIEIYEGAEAVQNAYDEIFDHFHSRHELCFITSINDVTKFAPFAIDQFAAKIKKNPSYQIRELIADDEFGRRYVRRWREIGATHLIRLLSAEFPLYNDIVICGEKTFIFSFKKRVFVSVIENSEVTRTFWTLFELAWVNGKAQ